MHRFVTGPQSTPATRVNAKRDGDAHGDRVAPGATGRTGRRGAFAATLLLGLATLAGGCTGSGIGDPCVPESVPTDGFDSREVYLETGSVQCRTRVCMVFGLEGDPRQVQGSDSCEPGSGTCVSAQALEQQVFCSCRCDVPAGDQANTPLCDCGGGFTCVDDVVTTGGVGVRGAYCVPCIDPDNPRQPPLDPTVFDECPPDEG